MADEALTHVWAVRFCPVEKKHLLVSAEIEKITSPRIYLKETSQAFDYCQMFDRDEACLTPESAWIKYRRRIEKEVSWKKDQLEKAKQAQDVLNRDFADWCQDRSN